MLEYALFFVIGLFIGALSGIVPGLHPNLISAITVVQDIGYEKKAVLLVSLYSGHIIFSAIPSVFFGIPDERTVTSVLPGQRMAKHGEGMLAVKTIAVSALVASLGAFLLMGPAIEFYPVAYGAVRAYLLPILALASLILVLKTKNPLYAALIFLAAGFLGAYALRTTMQDAFLPLFSGMFAMGAIMNYMKQPMPPQKDGKLDSGIVKYALLGMLLGGLANLIPAVSSPAQIAAFASLFIAFESGNYLATVAAVNVGQFLFALASSVSIEKARHGVIVNLGEVIDIGSNMQMLLFYFLLGIGISAAVLFLMRKRIAMLANIDFSVFNKLLALYLVIVVLLLDGIPGLLVFAAASLIGFFTLRLGVERTVMMGAIIVPTLMLLA